MVNIAYNESTYLVLVEFVKRLGFNLFESIVATWGNVKHLIDFGIFLAVSKQVYLFEILLSKHYLSTKIIFI